MWLGRMFGINGVGAGGLGLSRWLGLFLWKFMCNRRFLLAICRTPHRAFYHCLDPEHQAFCVAYVAVLWVQESGSCFGVRAGFFEVVFSFE